MKDPEPERWAGGGRGGQGALEVPTVLKALSGASSLSAPVEPPLIKSPSLKTGDPCSPSIHRSLALAASHFLIIYVKYLIGHEIAEPGVTYAPGDSVKLQSATRMHEIFLQKFAFSDH